MQRVFKTESYYPLSDFQLSLKFPMKVQATPTFAFDAAIQEYKDNKQHHGNQWRDWDYECLNLFVVLLLVTAAQCNVFQVFFL